MIRPYIGATGFYYPQEVQTAVNECFLNTPKLPPGNPYQLMAGYLISHETLNGGAGKFPKRYPSLKEIRELFSNSPDVLNLVHYNTKNPKFADELTQICDILGDSLNGFQLNICWPDFDEIERFKRNNQSKTIVLQIGHRAFEEVHNDPARLTTRLILEYSGLLEYVLLDPSGGLGKEMDIQKTHSYLSELYDAGVQKHIGIGIAGGLSAANLSQILPLVDKFDNLSIDAEGKLRDKETDELNTDLLVDYIRAAKELLS